MSPPERPKGRFFIPLRFAIQLIVLEIPKHSPIWEITAGRLDSSTRNERRTQMANMTHFDPFQISALDPFDDVFKGFFRPVRIEGAPEMQIKMDVKEDSKGYTVHAEIPGVKKEDIHVTIDGNQVSISAEVKQEKEVKEGEKVLRSERYYGKVARSFSVAGDIDESASQAKYADGVLELVLPKKAVSSSKKLTIN
jgi:HSP20 family protein